MVGFQIDLRRLPEKEREHGGIINDALSNLTTFTGQFRAALVLSGVSRRNVRASLDKFATTMDMKYNENAHLFREWALIAARDGAMSIFHFARSIRAIRRNLGHCPSLNRKEISKRLRIAEKLFASWFPDFEEIRHSAAHAGELAEDPSKKERRISRAGRQSDKFKIPKGSPMIERGSLDGDRLTYTLEDRIISYDITPETWKKLENIRTKIFDAFHA